MTTNQTTSHPTCPQCDQPLEDSDGHGTGHYWFCQTPDCGVIAHYVSAR
jgi:hypothetical protein